MERPRRRVAKYNENVAVEEGSRARKKRSKEQNIKQEIKMSPPSTLKTTASPRTPLRTIDNSISLGSISVGVKSENRNGLRVMGGGGKLSTSLPRSPSTPASLCEAVGSFLSAGEFKLIAPGKPAFHKKTCYSLFSEDTLKPEKFFVEFPELNQLTKMQMDLLILTNSVGYFMVKEGADAGTLNENSLEYSLALYCLCLGSVTSNEQLAQHCHSLLVASAPSFGLLELLTVLFNWGVISSTERKLPQRIANIAVDTKTTPQTPTNCSKLPTRYNVRMFCDVVEFLATSLPADDLQELLPSLVNLAMDMTLAPVRPRVTGAIQSCLKALSDSAEYKTKDLIKWLQLDSKICDDMGNFRYLCTAVLPKSEFCQKLILHVIDCRIRTGAKGGCTRRRSKTSDITVQTVVSLLASHRCRILKKLLAQSHYDLYQFLVLLESLLVINALKMEYDITESITTIINWLNGAFNPLNDSKSCYFFEIMNQLKGFCMVWSTKYIPEDSSD